MGQAALRYIVRPVIIHVYLAKPVSAMTVGSPVVVVLIRS